MQPYTGFASVYDIFMDNVPYDDWADYVKHLLNKFKIEKGLILELGCGTGSMTTRLADRGYDMIGIDSSEEMLTIARKNSEAGEKNILYLCQDMREFELYGTVAAVVSVCDSMNYILSEEDLLQVFRLVNNYLDPGGLFIFDLDTQYAYEEVLGDSTIAENREEGSFIWENTYYEEEMINEINLTLFIPEAADTQSTDYRGNGNDERKVRHTDKDTEDNRDGSTIGCNNENLKGQAERQKDVWNPVYRKYVETHYRRAYDLDIIKRLLKEAGMELIAVYDALTEKRPKKDSERVYIIAREKHQEGKTYL
ncbi:MAG: hypothetical protein K0S76_824 [Herbinix sp.]|jgi:SAM-dependent methyltransferase|nr:hypothetical protein [Herbinix sp.]